MIHFTCTGPPGRMNRRAGKRNFVYMGASCESIIEEEAFAAAEGTAAYMAEAGPDQIAQGLGLHIIRVTDVVAHERFNGERVAGLMARIAAEEKLINPPIVVVYAGRYVVLDGATRITAFRRLGYPFIVVQVVDLHAHRVRLDTWQHTLHGGSPAELLAMLATLDGLEITPVAADKLLGRTPVNPMIGYLLTPGGKGYLLTARPQAPNEDWLAIFNRVVDACGEWGRIERTLSTDLDALQAHYPDLAGHFVFHGFEAEEVLALAITGRPVPAGITRFVIPGRILRLNVPLDRLAIDEPPAAKRAWLDELLARKIANRQMRYYEEPVILLDE